MDISPKRKNSATKPLSWIEFLPQLIFALFIIIFVAYSLYDYEELINIFDSFITWLKKDPYAAGIAILGTFCFL